MNVSTAIHKLNEFTNEYVYVTHYTNGYGDQPWKIFIGDRQTYFTNGRTVRAAFLKARRRLIDLALYKERET